MATTASRCWASTATASRRFLKLLSGAIQPQSGKIQKSNKLRIGYFAQHQSEAFDMEKSMLAEAKSWMKTLTEEKVRAHLGRFGFSGQRVETKIGNLSGGEKARLLLALITKDAPHILLLDEPTNHLDIDSREALLRAINDYEGAVILVTHDPHLVELTADRLWLVDKGTVTPFTGDLDEYTSYIAKERKTALAEGKPPKPEKAAKVAGAKKPGAWRQVVKVAEADMARLKTEIAAFEKQIAAPDFYRKTSDVISGARRGLTEAQEKLAAAETSWLEATAELEKVSS